MRYPDLIDPRRRDPRSNRRLKKRQGLLALSFLPLVLSFHCYLDNPSPANSAVTDAGATGEVDASASDPGADGSVAPVDAGPPLCTKYGGYGTVEVVIADLVSTLVADCRISRFFTTLSETAVHHLVDCLVKQVAVLMRCPGIRYDVDNDGAECRDMTAAHKGLSIRQGDFDALVEDLVAVLRKDGVSTEDIDALAPSILALAPDIVTNSAPGNGHAVCDASSTDGAR